MTVPECFSVPVKELSSVCNEGATALLPCTGVTVKTKQEYTYTGGREFRSVPMPKTNVMVVGRQRSNSNR